MQLFYSEHIGTSHYELPKDESRHLIQVLRKNIGDQIWFTNGKGIKALYEIEGDNAKKTRLKLISKEDIPVVVPKLTIGIAPTKNMDRLEWFLEKATEIGVYMVVLFISEHSERKKVRLDRMEKILIAAMKQSQQFHKPILVGPITLNELLISDNGANKFICNQVEGKSNHLSELLIKDQAATILIGPEGDFSSDELKLANENHFKYVSLGSNRLRTETAGVVACQIFSTPH